MFLTSKKFWVDAAERVLASIAGVILGMPLIGSTGLFAVNWTVVVSVAGSAGLMSLLKAIVKAQAADSPADPVDPPK